MTFAILVVLLFGLYFFSDWFSKTVGYVAGEEQKIRLMQCLNEKQVVLYVVDDCYYCDRQRGLIGETAMGYFDALLNCDSGESVACENLASFPAWKINGEIRYGVLEISELSEISRCNLEVK